MKIGIDAKNLCGPLSGISRYMLNMITHLAQREVELVLFAPRPLHNEQLVHKNIKQVTNNLHGRVGNIIWSQFVLPRNVRAHDIDVFWGPAHRLPALPANLPKILTVHDMVWKKHPETMAKLGLVGERLFMPAALKRADKIVCLSHYTKSDLVQHDARLDDIISVIYPGATKPNAATHGVEEAKTEQAYMLFVGTHEPRKNLEKLLRAYGELTQAQKDKCHLRIIGASGWKQDHLKTLAAELGLSNHVNWSGFVDDVELERAYQNARFQVLPSIFEGFGLPIIEAQKYGKPVLTSNCSSMPEVLGEGGILVDPNSIDSIKTGLAQLIDDDALRAELGKKAKINATRFDWQLGARDFELLCNSVLVEKRQER